jgi:HAD superfamily hydrolase (TIGR01662 family)
MNASMRLDVPARLQTLGRPTRPTWSVPSPLTGLRPHRPGAVLFDGAGMLMLDVPDPGDPTPARAVPGVRDALDALRDADVRVGVVSASDGDGDLAARNRAAERQLGRLDVWCVCEAAPGDECRRTDPELVLDACTRLGVPPDRTVLVGDVVADIEAALAIGVYAVLVPTDAMSADDIAAVPVVADTVGEAVAIALGLLS